jgi:hypothetical protein
LKAYELANEKYNLDEWWSDHLPALNRLNQLNLFAYGLSPGRFGGINANLMEAVGSSSIGLFTPVGLSIKNARDAAEVQALMRELTRPINDIAWFMDDMRSQWEVATTPSRSTSDAQIRDGYAEWNEYKRQVGDQLEELGATFTDMRYKPWLSGVWAEYEAKRAELGQKYPAWANQRKKVTQDRVNKNMEKSDSLARVEADPASATPLDFALAEMEALLAQLKQEAEWNGFEVGGQNGWDDAPPDMFETVQRAGLAQLSRNPKFKSLWDRFYRNDFGLLEASI